MTKPTPYNPLEKLNIARSIEMELLARPVAALANVEGILGAGVYVIYYTGSFPAYAPIAAANRNSAFATPIYIGKAIPKGGRKGGLTLDAGSGRALGERLGQHAASIREATNIDLADFQFRHLVVDDIWIPLGENMLVETFEPLWNRIIDGFGNKDPGNRRATQYKSPWDVLHPGRKFSQKLASGPLLVTLLNQRIDDHFAGRPPARLPKVIEDQQATASYDEER